MTTNNNGISNNRNIIIVGAGLFGLTIARQIVEKFNTPVTIVDKRNHIGGNAYSYIDEQTGIDVHKYGAHIFHTSIKRVWDFANRFSKFNSYSHKVWTVFNGEVFPLPINLGTINQFFRANYTPEQAQKLIKEQSGVYANTQPKNLEEQGKKLIGEPLFNAFIKNYTEKQWQTSAKELSPEIIKRLPVRYNYDNRYFNDDFEGIPVDGYGVWLKNMANHPLINIILENDFLSDGKVNKKNISQNSLVVFTGPIDRYYDYEYGMLGWRTIDFDTKTIDITDFQGNSVINYADAAEKFTRIIEYKHFMLNKATSQIGKTVISYEYSRNASKDDSPYYPIRTDEDIKKFNAYEQLAAKDKNIIFGGRLGNYTYYDMDKVIESALQTFEKTISKML